MAHDRVDLTLILSLKHIRPIAPHLLDLLNGANEAHQVQKRQALKESCQRVAEHHEALSDALLTLSTIPIPPAAQLRKRGPMENHCLQSGMHHVSLIYPRLRPNVS